MPVLVLLTGASAMTFFEFLLQDHHTHTVQVLFVFLGFVWGGGMVLSSRAAWRWWKKNESAHGAVSTTPAPCMDVIAHSPASKRHIETASGTAERVLKKQISGPALDAENSSKALFMVDTIA